jgi:hypothetical protein
MTKKRRSGAGARMTAAENLRHRRAEVFIDGRYRPVTIVTHIRHDIWLVEGSRLPIRFERYRGMRRTTVGRSILRVLA